jgi:hypothetical protein
MLVDDQPLADGGQAGDILRQVLQQIFVSAGVGHRPGRAVEAERGRLVQNPHDP